MKAIEWAQKFNTAFADKSEEPLYDVMESFCQETMALIHQRGKGSTTKTAVGVIASIVKEQRQKWNAICKHCAFLKSDVFETLVDCMELNNIEKGYEDLIHRKRNYEQRKRKIGSYRKRSL